MDEYLGDQKEYQKAVDDGFQGTYEEFLRMKSLERKELAIGGGVIQGKDYGTREGFVRPKKSKQKMTVNQALEEIFKTKTNTVLLIYVPLFLVFFCIEKKIKDSGT